MSTALAVRRNGVLIGMTLSIPALTLVGSELAGLMIAEVAQVPPAPVTKEFISAIDPA